MAKWQTFASRTVVFLSETDVQIYENHSRTCVRLVDFLYTLGGYKKQVYNSPFNVRLSPNLGDNSPGGGRLTSGVRFQPISVARCTGNAETCKKPNVMKEKFCWDSARFGRKSRERNALHRNFASVQWQKELVREKTYTASSNWTITNIFRTY